MGDIVERLRQPVPGIGFEDHDPTFDDRMDAAKEIERLRAELERERTFKESYYSQLQEIFAKYAKYNQWSEKPDGYVGDAPYWKGPSKNE